jgi:hypothetical protein
LYLLGHEALLLDDSLGLPFRRNRRVSLLFILLPMAIVSGAIFIHFRLFALGSFLLNYVHQHAIHIVNWFIQHVGGIWMVV